MSVPFGVLGTVWSYLKLRELGVRRPAGLDWWGNVTLLGHGLVIGIFFTLIILGLDIAFDFAIAACLVAAVASLLRGRRYVHEEHGPAVRAGRTTQELVRP